MAEIEELKQSLRYVEIQLAKSQEDKESLQSKIKTMDSDMEQAQDNIAKQIAINSEQKNQIENLQTKINSFSQNQSQVSCFRDLVF